MTRLVLALSVFSWGLFASTTQADERFFRDKIQPLLRKHCWRCHGAENQEAKLRLDQKSNALKGTNGGPVIVPGAPEKSKLIERISEESADKRMPPDGEGAPLSKLEIDLIARWIKAGANWPEGVDPKNDKKTSAPLWGFQPIRRPSLPDTVRDSWVQNPIDAFVLRKLRQSGMQPAKRASARVLARRAHFDLLGLPPTQLTDEAATHESYARLIDTLLANPHYGERWGRHWLDLVRYADSNGYEVDGEKPLAWKYRDYVIAALNSDLPYDAFIREQLAGDELPSATSRTVIATGFYRVGPWDAERGASVQPSEVVEERYNELDDMVSTTSQVFLGLTLGCARCHDHKFDPLTARDYYSMVAIFSPLTRHKKGRGELTRPAAPPRELAAKNKADQEITRLRQEIQSAVEPVAKGLLATGQSKLPADAVAAFKVAPAKRTDAEKQLTKRYTQTLDRTVNAALADGKLALKFISQRTLQQIRKSRRRIEGLRNQFVFPQGYFFYEPSPPRPPEIRLLKRGNPKQPGAVMQPAVPVAIGVQARQPQPKFEKPDGYTTRRRISLARWVANKKNPLTARVFVNRVWQYHFGMGIVRSANDFGRRGSEPSHAELLDWLAHWFMHDADWSIKRLHRLIMTSNTYQMSKVRNEAFAKKDPDNLLLWRFPYRRLEVEAIRDAMLSVSGQLQPSLYGPSMYPHIPSEALESGYNPKAAWKKFDEADASRRTIYAYVKRTLVVPFLESLDFCDTTRSAAQRNITTVAPQALELLNGEFSNRQARHFARRLIREAGRDLDAQLRKAIELGLGRKAIQSELKLLKELWLDSRKDMKSGKHSSNELDQMALTQVCRVIFSLNEFVYID